MRKEAEEFYGVEVTSVPCEGPRGQSYKRMKLDEARMPTVATRGQSAVPSNADMLLPIPDESEDLFEPPFPESRYVGHVYDNHVGGHVNKPRKKPPARASVKKRV